MPRNLDDCTLVTYIVFTHLFLFRSASTERLIYNSFIMFGFAQFNYIINYFIFNNRCQKHGVGPMIDVSDASSPLHSKCLGNLF